MKRAKATRSSKGRRGAFSFWRTPTAMVGSTNAKCSSTRFFFQPDCKWASAGCGLVRRRICYLFPIKTATTCPMPTPPWCSMAGAGRTGMRRSTVLCGGPTAGCTAATACSRTAKWVRPARRKKTACRSMPACGAIIPRGKISKCSPGAPAIRGGSISTAAAKPLSPPASYRTFGTWCRAGAIIARRPAF